MPIATTLGSVVTYYKGLPTISQITLCNTPY